VLEKVVEDISFTAGDRSGEAVVIDAAYVTERIGPLTADKDLSRFIL
jgi:ATP-dependent HslUV protease ATP-binding subunit HslU